MAKKELKEQLKSYEGYINDIPSVIDPCKMCKVYKENRGYEWHYPSKGELPGESEEEIKEKGEKVYAIFKNNSYYIIDRASVKNYEDLIAWTELPTF